MFISLIINWSILPIALLLHVLQLSCCLENCIKVSAAWELLSGMTLTLCLATKCRASLPINATSYQYRFLVCTYTSISGGIERFKARGKPQIGYINPRYLQIVYLQTVGFSAQKIENHFPNTCQWECLGHLVVGSWGTKSQANVTCKILIKTKLNQYLNNSKKNLIKLY